MVEKLEGAEQNKRQSDLQNASAKKLHRILTTPPIILQTLNLLKIKFAIPIIFAIANCSISKTVIQDIEMCKLKNHIICQCVI
jgi:hypothetical protein